MAMKKQILEKVRILPNVTLPSAENGQRQRKEKRAKKCCRNQALIRDGICAWER